MNAYYVILIRQIMMVGIMGGTEHPNIMKKKVQKNIAKAVYLPKTASVNDLSTLH
jgi:hypothetical protein